MITNKLKEHTVPGENVRFCFQKDSHDNYQKV